MTIQLPGFPVSLHNNRKGLIDIRVDNKGTVCLHQKTLCNNG